MSRSGSQRGDKWISGSIIDAVESFHSEYLNKLEVEVRFNEYIKNPFALERRDKSFGVDESTFTRLITYFDTKVQAKAPVYSTTELSNGSIRYIINNHTNEVKYMMKTKNTEPWDNTNFNYRIAINLEEDIPPPDKFVALSKRAKNRRSYLFDNNYRVDLTEVTQYNNKDNVINNTFEIELEIIKLASIINEDWVSGYRKNIQRVLTAILDSPIPYTVETSENLIKYYNETMSQACPALDPWKFEVRNKILDHRQIYKPRNLHQKDLVYGGLVGNSHEKYLVTWKADGEHRLLLIHGEIREAYNIWRVWLVQPPKTHTLIYEKLCKGDDETIVEINKIFKNVAGTIIEGELIPKNKQKGEYLALSQRYKFLAFDCLSTPSDRADSIVGNVEIQYKDFGKRREKAEELINYLKVIGEYDVDFTNRIIDIKWKQQDLVESILGFYAKINERLDQIPLLGYETDGLIFTPVFMPYNSGNHNLLLKQRVLTSVSDICKWKPSLQKDKEGREHNMWTVDLMLLRHNPETNIAGGLYTRNKERGKNVYTQFTGTNINPFEQTMVDWEAVNAIPGLQDNMVIEFEWLSDRQVLSPKQLRLDKVGRPNTKSISEDNWDLALNPLSEETIRGRDIKLMRAYHNRIKKLLFDTTLQNLTCGSSSSSLASSLAEDKPTFLDIGSGRGGDLTKLLNYGRGVFIEPNVENILEFYRRLRSIFKVSVPLENMTILETDNEETVNAKINHVKSSNNKFIIINTGGENYNLITYCVRKFIGQEVDMISVMLSLSFFWQTDIVLGGLVQTLKNNLKHGGELIYLTIDGDLVQQMFDPTFRDGETTSEIRIGSSFQGEPTDSFVVMNYSDTARELFVNFPGTIVENQTEWLVRLDDIELRLLDDGFIMDEKHRADKEEFLNTTERLLTKLYSYGKFIRL